MSKILRNILFVLTILLFTLSAVFAGGMTQKITVFLNNFNVEINGIKVETDVYGYKNDTFISLTKLAEMLGKGIDTDKKTDTVNIYDIRPLPDSEIKGLWKTVDIVDSFYLFDPKVRSYEGDYYIKEMLFADNGELSVNNVPDPYTLWGDGVVFSGVFKDNEIGDKRTASTYAVKTIKGEQYMFFAYKNGDYMNNGANPILYVLKKYNTAVTAPEFR